MWTFTVYPPPSPPFHFPFNLTARIFLLSMVVSRGGSCHLSASMPCMLIPIVEINISRCGWSCHLPSQGNYIWLEVRPPTGISTNTDMSVLIADLLGLVLLEARMSCKNANRRCFGRRSSCACRQPPELLAVPGCDPAPEGQVGGPHWHARGPQVQVKPFYSDVSTPPLANPLRPCHLGRTCRALKHKMNQT